MSANDILGYIFTTISFLSVVYAVFGDSTGIYACILVIFALLSYLFLVYYIRIVKNKTYTLQILSRENRPLSIRLLLTYERLLRSQDELPERFFPSKLHVDCAHYHYEILQSNSKIKDLKCTFTFQIKKIPKSQQTVDILIAQQRGKELNAINYKFNKNTQEQVANVTSLVSRQDKVGLQGFWKASIPLTSDDRIDTLIVSFTLKAVHRIALDECGTILLCPFIYAKRVDWFDIEVRYPDDPAYQPDTICLMFYPYDGKKYRPQNLKNFETRDRLSWTISSSRCVTKAIYIIETHNLPKE